MQSWWDSLTKTQGSGMWTQVRTLVLNLLYGSTLTSGHDYWKNHSFDYMDLRWQSDGFAF